MAFVARFWVMSTKLESMVLLYRSVVFKLIFSNRNLALPHQILPRSFMREPKESRATLVRAEVRKTKWLVQAPPPSPSPHSHLKVPAPIPGALQPKDNL